MGKTNSKIKYVIASFLLVAAVIIANAVFGGVFAEGITITQNGSRLTVNAEDDESVQWMRADTADGAYENIADATEKYYDLTAEDSNKYIKVVAGSLGEQESAPIEIKKVVVFDLSKGSVTFGATYSGGGVTSGTHEASNIYIVTQSENEAYSTNKISFTGTVNIPFDVTISDIHLGSTAVTGKTPDASGIGSYANGVIDIQAGVGTKSVVLRLKGENIVKAVHYYTNGSASNSSLKITDINGDGASEGKLYVPIKAEGKDEIESYVNSKLAYNHWNSGIGGDDSSGDKVENLEIAGGYVQVLTSYADNCTAIGAGGNGYCKMKISGGKIVAHCSGTGAAIGGGIGWHSGGGTSDITITGGDVYAENHGKIYVRATYNADGSISGTTIVDKDDPYGYNEIIGGVAIGSGSSVKSGGSTGTVKITGGNVEAYGAYGNGIGGGNSSSSAGGQATIDINGKAIVKASSIGGGNSKNKTGGEATVMISDEADVTLINGIGGGSSDSGNGGKATITVTGGTINCGDVIGGGNGGENGDGGTATINVSGGTLTSKSIGGGTGGESGDGGAAEITISGGTITTGSIGGGDTLNKTDGKIGYATADISGGDISGQFLLMAGGTEPCYFNMTGGTLHGVNTADDSEYSYAKLDGAAVYMDDPSGTVTISGGTIKDCSAENGGAIYMTAGSFELSGTGYISGNIATESGGAIYLGGGTVTIKGGEISRNTAAENGGGAYLGGGELTVDGGTVSSNSAKNGGGAFVEGGQVLVFSGNIENNTAEINGGGFDINNGSFGMTGGSVNKNEAKTGSGGGIYVSADDANVVVDVLSGSVSNNKAAETGGALAVVGDKESENKITVTIGVDGLHNNVKCHHGGNYIDESFKIIEDCPQTNANYAGQKGGAFFVTGNNEYTTLNIYCLVENEVNSAGGENGQSNFMKVEGGRVLVTTSKEMNENDKTSQNDYNGNISIKSTIYVTGGDFDIWGKMINPDIAETITVDIVNPETDEFDDNRINDSDAVIYYKLLYYENFEDPKTGQTTGQYKEVRVLKGEKEEILGNIYVHPGYTIKGWNTKPKDYDNALQAKLDDESGYIKENDAEGWYQVGSEYAFNGYCRGDLTIYAIWEANGYTVTFNANVPVGETVYGTMADINLTFNQPENLPANTYSRPGYEFTGWNTEPDRSGKDFKDQEEVENLTTGSNLVTLYAQWEKCAHENPEKYIYTLIEDGKGIKLECSCGGYSETVILSAKDTVYNREEQPAELKRSTTIPV